jgi:transposase
MVAGARAARQAQVALSNIQLTVYHKLLSTPGTRYQDLGADYNDKHAQTRREVRHHLTELDTLGYDVIITPQARPRRRGNRARPSRLTRRHSSEPTA